MLDIDSKPVPAKFVPVFRDDPRVQLIKITRVEDNGAIRVTYCQRYIGALISLTNFISIDASIPGMLESSNLHTSYSEPQIEWDEERDEPYCNVEIKGEQYRMTMWRESDGDDMVSSQRYCFESFGMRY